MNLMQQNQKTLHWATKIFKEADLIEHGEAARIILEDSCMEGRKGEILIGGIDEFLQVQFLRLTASILVLEIGTRTLGLRADDILQVSFIYNDRLHNFKASLVRITDSSRPDRRQMELFIPEEILSSQVRRTFRIPTAACLDLDGELEFKGRCCRAVVLDISLGGLRADLYADMDLPIQKGDHGIVRLAFKDQKIARNVEIRRIRKSVVHVSFASDAEELSQDTDIEFIRFLIALGDNWQGR